MLQDEMGSQCWKGRELVGKRVQAKSKSCTGVFVYYKPVDEATSLHSTYCNPEIGHDFRS